MAFLEIFSEPAVILGGLQGLRGHIRGWREVDQVSLLHDRAAQAPGQMDQPLGLGCRGDREQGCCAGGRALCPPKAPLPACAMQEPGPAGTKSLGSRKARILYKNLRA